MIIIKKHTVGLKTTHNLDGKFTRCWRLHADGTVDRTNSASKYQIYKQSEKIPDAIIEAAAENNITILPGRHV